MEERVIHLPQNSKFNYQEENVFWKQCGKMRKNPCDWHLLVFQKYISMGETNTIVSACLYNV